MKLDQRVPLVLVLTALTVLAADQLTKEIVRHNIHPSEAVPEQGVIRFVNVTNDGIIFGLGAPRWFAIAMPVVLVLAVLAAYYWYHPLGGKAMNVCIGTFIGGTLGNWVDRLRFSGVTDFIDVRIKNDVHWFTFNLADVAILLAIVIFVVAIFGLWPRKANPGPRQGPPGGPTGGG